jgi:hypothetical protein
MLLLVRRSFGYALTGNRPVQVLSYDTRSERVFAVCAFSVFGFEDWRFVTGTYNTERFNEACDDVVLDNGALQRGMLRPLVRKFPIVVLDNAAIHKSAEFEDMVNEEGGIVIFTPPYCWDTAPLDSGAFGWVRRYLQANQELCATIGLERALSRAFRAVTPSMARSF